jgi:hypothetical protein
VTEKWVVVAMMYDTNDGVDEVHGIFDNKYEAEQWARNEYYSKSYEVVRIRRAVVEEWA